MNDTDTDLDENECAEREYFPETCKETLAKEKEYLLTALNRVSRDLMKINDGFYDLKEKYYQALHHLIGINPPFALSADTLTALGAYISKLESYRELTEKQLYLKSKLVRCDLYESLSVREAVLKGSII